MQVGCITFTESGVRVIEQVREKRKDITWVCAVFHRYEKAGFLPFTNIKELIAEWFTSMDAILFVCATGIAVRALAPFLSSKLTDPAVIVIDDQGKFVIPLLSGHIGGANELALEIAKVLSSVAVITTATDGRQKLAIDVWAMKRNLWISDMGLAKEVAADFIQGKEVSFHNALKDAKLLEKVREEESIKKYLDCFQKPEDFTDEVTAFGVEISFWEEQRAFSKTLTLLPKRLVLGIGCRKEISPEIVERVVKEVCSEYECSLRCISKVCSIDRKREEQAIVMFAQKYQVPFETYSTKELEQVVGSFTSSMFVKSTVGIENVCERSAVAGCKSGCLLVKKQAKDGVTVAIALETAVDKEIER